MHELRPRFPELVPLFPENQGIGARIIEIQGVLQNKGIPTKNPVGSSVAPGLMTCRMTNRIPILPFIGVWRSPCGVTLSTFRQDFTAGGATPGFTHIPVDLMYFRQAPE